MSIGQNYTSISPEMGWYQMITGVVTTAIQVTADLTDPKTRKREFEGLYEAMTEFGLSEGYILTKEGFETVTDKGKVIHLMPVWYWILH